jgi:type II secretory pathway pseudopilin PulG
MVVVAIISILLTLLIPNIRIMREKAWSANCQNNLRQYGIAMNQYMAAGSAGGGGGGRTAWGKDLHVNKADYPGGVIQRGGSATSVSVGPPIFNNIVSSIPMDGTNQLQSLSAGNPSVRVCPVVLQQIRKNGNFFDTNSPNFKGTYEDPVSLDVTADFEDTSSTSDNLSLNSWFSTYAINPIKGNTGNYIKDIPQNVVAYIDWNARDGWGAYLGYTNWMFTGTNSQGVHVDQNQPKWTNNWMITEVGFYHRNGNEYGANYVAMDGHVGWISSNAISITNFAGP